MFERYTLSSTYFPSQTFDETGCDYLVFPTPGKKDSVTVDIYYSLEEGKEITPKKSIYSTSKHTTTFQVGTQSSNSLIKPTRKLLVRAFTSSSKLFTSIPRLIPEFLNPTSTTNHVTSSYGIYTMALATRTTSVTIEVKINKSLHFQVNRLSIHRVTSITT